MAILKWSKDRKVDWHYTVPSKPTHDYFVESFNGRLAMRTSTKGCLPQWLRFARCRHKGGKIAMLCGATQNLLDAPRRNCKTGSIADSAKEFVIPLTTKHLTEGLYL